MTETETQAAENRLIRQTIDEITDTYDHEYWLECCLNDQFPKELWDTLVEQDIVGLNVPEDYGGSGMGIRETATVVQALNRNGVHMGIMLLHAAMTPFTIARHGSSSLKDRFLPMVAEGSAKFCMGITEINAGSNTFEIKTRAERAGDEYVVNGSKSYISAADLADYMVLVTRTTPYEDLDRSERSMGMSLLVVPMDADGITLTPLDLAITEEIDQFSVYFDDVSVAVENRIGAEGEGFRYLLDSLNPERITSASTAIGLGRFALQRAVEYSKEREVFGAPIGSHQGVQHPLARSKIQLDLAELAMEEAIDRYEAADDDAGRYANIAKFAASEAAGQTVDAAMQAHGGLGFSRDHGVINVAQIARLSRIAPINNEMVLNYIGEHVLGLPRSY
jgi:acyl-CoA dehydrogenase